LGKRIRWAVVSVGLVEEEDMDMAQVPPYEVPRLLDTALAVVHGT
jgi:hypothetical protein